MKFFLRMECLNCGIRGHTFRECRLPVMSYGVIAIKPTLVEGHIEPRYLMIRRKDSLSYVEFLRGKYKLTNHAYIQLLCNEMTSMERERLLTIPFTDLWYALWNGQHTRQFRNESDVAQSTFNTLRDVGDSEGKKLSAYIAACTHVYTEPEWGFPKGRRNIHESDLRCAVREWREETGLLDSSLQILAGERPCEEEYTGSNGIPYKQMYFLGVCPSKTTVELTAENIVMMREIGGIGWYTLEEALTLIRATNPVKRELLQQIHRRIKTGDLRHLMTTAIM